MNALTVRTGLMFAVLIFAVPTSHGQQATEVYIPIGNSPGVSTTSSLRGEIRRLDYASRSIELLDRGSMKTVHLSDATRYYLDRSGYGKKNETGNMQDCKVGRLIEVHVSANGDVQWIKIKVD